MSDIIKEEAKKNDMPEPEIHSWLSPLAEGLSNEAININKLQQWGNTLRHMKGNDFLARRAIQRIAAYRSEHGGLEQASGDTAEVAKPLFVAHIVRSVKHKDEYNLLKAVYGDILFLIAVSDKFEKRVKNFRHSVDSIKENEKIVEEYEILSAIDQDEGVNHGQQVTEIFHKANIFLNNDTVSIQESIAHFLGLLFERKICSPTLDERMMFEAFVASMRSTCLSRQVGAAIADKDGELVSVGWNDIPCVGGGLVVDNGDWSDSLCKSKGECRSTVEIDKLVNNIYLRLKDSGFVKKNAKRDDVVDSLKSAGLSSLIEFSRAIHAEMEALISAARTAKAGLKGGTIYVTTYPCDNCAKHLIAAGITRVVYIEPYAKSKAKEFFSDFITDDEGVDDVPKKDSKVAFVQFTGISHQSYVQLFRKAGARKDKSGKIINPQGKNKPLTDVYLDGYPLYEARIARELDND